MDFSFQLCLDLVGLHLGQFLGFKATKLDKSSYNGE